MSHPDAPALRRGLDPCAPTVEVPGQARDVAGPGPERRRTSGLPSTRRVGNLPTINRLTQ
jgi:hypothetical protein